MRKFNKNHFLTILAFILSIIIILIAIMLIASVFSNNVSANQTLDAFLNIYPI